VERRALKSAELVIQQPLPPEGENHGPCSCCDRFPHLSDSELYACLVQYSRYASRRVNLVLSWMHPKCGWFRVQRDTCAAVIFPSAEVSYHTRFSKLKGPAKPCYPLLAGASRHAPPGNQAFMPLSGESVTPLGPHEVSVVYLFRARRRRSKTTLVNQW
jgi:hypothetical protein